MLPGLSPIFYAAIPPSPNYTNVPPPGNDRRISFGPPQPNNDQPQVEDKFTEQGNPWLETWRFGA